MIIESIQTGTRLVFIMLETTMIKFLKKLVWIFSLAFMLSLWNNVFAALDWFAVEIKDTIKVWEAADFTVSAIQDGKAYKEFSWAILLDIKDRNWNDLDSYYYTLPNDEFYQFVDTDQWVKTFWWWLTINKEWNYKILVYGLSDSDGMWYADVSVVGENGIQDTETIEIAYPSDWAIESKNNVTVVWACEKLKNSPVIIYLNGKAVGSWNTDSKWNFSVYTPNLLSGKNEIQAKIVDINNIVLGESKIISVEYKSLDDGIYKSIEILPSNQVKQWDKVIFNVLTDDDVVSAQLLFNNWLKYSLDRIWQGMFSKEIEAINPGTIDVSLSLLVNSSADEKIYEKIETLNVEEYVWISNIKFAMTGVDWTQVIVSWDTIWEVSKYQINYWTWKENLDKTITVTSSNILVENLEKDISYFFQIIPQDAESHTSWDPSEIVEYHASILPCVVKWIKVTTEKIWDNYYLVRDPVENAISYEVYRSDWADMTDSRLVWNLTGTRFQYLYNPDVTRDEYAYYQVQAICPDGQNMVVDKAQKVKVWPVENILLIIVLSIFVYSLYKLNRISDDN